MAPQVPAALALAGAALLFLSPPLQASQPLDGPVIEATDTNLLDNRYEPRSTDALPGAVVTVRNTGSDRHTLTAVQEGAWPEVELGPGESRTFTAPQRLGEHRFYCRYHASVAAAQETPQNGMAGMLEVVQTLASPPSSPPSSPPPSTPPGAPGDGGNRGTPLGLEVAVLAVGAAALLARRR